jgi:hypothetical protein
LPISIGGTFVRTYDNYLNPRTLTLPLALLILTALLKRRLWLAAVLVGLQLLLHPLSGLCMGLVIILLLAGWLWRKELSLRAAVGPLFVLLAVLGVLVWRSGGGGVLWLDPVWRSILWQRTSYVFLTSWTIEGWVSLGLYLLLGIIGWSSRQRSSMATQVNLAVLAVAMGSLVAVAVGGDWLGLAPLVQLQLARSWQLVLILAVIFGADVILSLYERGSWAAWLVAVLLAVVIYFDRAQLEWQPVLAALLVGILLARVVEQRWQEAGKHWASGLLVLVGVGVIGPALLMAWSVTKIWLSGFIAPLWLLPKEGLWPTVLLFGSLLCLSPVNYLRLPPGWWDKWARWVIGVGLAIMALLNILGAGYPQNWPVYLATRLQLPVSQAWMSPTFQAWLDVQLWAAANTTPEARFVTDPYEKGFRTFSQRSPLVEEKDGAAVMFSRAYAIEWNRRMQAVALTGGMNDPASKVEFAEFSEAGLRDLYRLYPFDYVVGRQPQHLNWPEVYRNQFYVVYAWPERLSAK